MPTAAGDGTGGVQDHSVVSWPVLKRQLSKDYEAISNLWWSSSADSNSSNIADNNMMKENNIDRFDTNGDVQQLVHQAQLLSSADDVGSKQWLGPTWKNNRSQTSVGGVTRPTKISAPEKKYVFRDHDKENLEGRRSTDSTKKVAKSETHKTGFQAVLNKKNKEQEGEILVLNERIAKLLETVSSQECLIDSLKSLNFDSEQSISSLMKLIGEKDQALADISNFNAMNNCANEKLLAHANEQLQEEVAKNGRLLEAIVSQTSFIDSLKSLNMESAENMSSMKELIGEKDKALAEMSRLLSHAKVDATSKRTREVKCALASLAMATALALVWPPILTAESLATTDPIGVLEVILLPFSSSAIGDIYF